jgi:glycosyltransferase involved in cell wall biosynthesis
MVLRSMLWKEKPELVHTWMYHADLLGGVAARLAGVRRVCWGIRSSNIDRGTVRWTTFAVRKFCAWISHALPDVILLNSEVALHVNAKVGYARSRMRVIPNGFDVSRFRPDEEARASIRAELGIGSGALLLGLVARWHPLKNILGFVEVAGTALRAFPDAHFVLVGNGLDAANVELTAAVAQWPGREHIHLLGPRVDVPALMAALDVFVLPSHGEGFPNVIGEAMASGVPCAVTDVGDCAELVSQTGRVAPKGDMAALAQATMELMNLSADERRLLGEQARERIASRFELNRVVRQHEDFYRQLVGPSGGLRGA